MTTQEKDMHFGFITLDEDSYFDELQELRELNLLCQDFDTQHRTPKMYEEF